MHVNMWHTRGMTTRSAPRPVPVVSPWAPTREIEEQALLLKALAEPMRLSILRIIASQHGQAVCACVFPDALGITQPTASHHLKRLVEAGLLTREQRGKWAWFALVPGRMNDVCELLGEIAAE